MGPDAKRLVEGIAAKEDILHELLGDNTTRPRLTIPWPGEPGKAPEDGGAGLSVSIWALGFDELTAAKLAAHKHFTETLKVPAEALYAAFQEDFDLEIKVQQLLLALRRADDPKRPLAKHAVDLRKLDPDVIQALYERLVMFTHTRSPFHKIKSLDELDEVIVDLGKGSEATETWLNSFDSVSLRLIVRELAGRLLRQMRQSSSDTSSPSDSSP